MRFLRRITGPWRWLAVGVAILLAVVVGLVSWHTAGGGADARWSAAGPAASEETGPPLGSTAAGRPAANGPGRQRSGSAGSAPPYVQPFAQQPGSTPHARLPSPTAAIQIAEGTDGCDHAYGDPDVCVPWQFPPGVTDKCGWLTEHAFKPLKITGGRDRHGLDRNGDGIACGSGD